MLNTVKGNMYEWITHTWNTVKGECPHGCHYCYMKRFGAQKPVRLDEKEFKTDLGRDNFIFVGSSCDMFAASIPAEWIVRTLEHCRRYPGNRYLFQSKNPNRIDSYRNLLPAGSVVGATIETNRRYHEMGNTPDPVDRVRAMAELRAAGLETMITIEPVMDFDMHAMIALMGACQPAWINIGANSNPKVKLTEPDAAKVEELIERLSANQEVKIKTNLGRLIGRHSNES